MLTSHRDRAPRALVAVLGDLGRSPRMLNHARALLAAGWQVTLAGLVETPLPADLADHPGVTDLSLAAAWPQRGPGAMWARMRLLGRLAGAPPTWSVAFVQNPPAFPLIAALSIRGRGRLVLDWHNLGHAVFALRGRPRLAVAAYRWLERAFGRRADVHWAVSRALATHVQQWLDVSGVTVVRDRPVETHDPITDRSGRLGWWHKTLPQIPPPPSDAAWVVMPSSWSSDEDFGLLHEAVRLLGGRRSEEPLRQPIVILATGEGPGRSAFLARFPRHPAVTVQSAWLPLPDYFELLARADAGLCLHCSASGLDLPHKLADMRAARLPALVLNYGAVLDEVSDAGSEGRLFGSAADLAGLLREVAEGSVPRAKSTGPLWLEEWQPAFSALTGSAGSNARPSRFESP